MRVQVDLGLGGLNVLLGFFTLNRFDSALLGLLLLLFNLLGLLFSLLLGLLLLHGLLLLLLLLGLFRRLRLPLLLLRLGLDDSLLRVVLVVATANQRQTARANAGPGRGPQQRSPR